MKSRCQNTKGLEYHNYGGRGIRVCDRWQDFSNFAADMGKTFREDLELERKDNSGNYEPSNCIWVNHTAQQRNKRTNHLVKIGGISKALIEWGEETGIKPNTILTRIRRGWDESKLLRPVNKPEEIDSDTCKCGQPFQESGCCSYCNTVRKAV